MGFTPNDSIQPTGGVNQLMCGVQDILYSFKGTGMLSTSGELTCPRKWLLFRGRNRGPDPCLEVGPP
jgi:hypothetical protein